MKSITFKMETKIDPVTWYADSHYVKQELSANKSGLRTDWKYAKHYRYLGAEPETQVITRIIETKVSKKQKIAPGEAYIVTLGGPFQEVGRQAENIGGDSQKIG